MADLPPYKRVIDGPPEVAPPVPAAAPAMVPTTPANDPARQPDAPVIAPFVQSTPAQKEQMAAAGLAVDAPPPAAAPVPPPQPTPGPAAPAIASQTETTRQMPLVETPEIKKLREQNVALRDKQIEAIGVQTDTELKKNAVVTEQNRAAQIEADRLQAKSIADAAHIEEQTRAATADWEAKRADRDANNKSDPEKFWKDKGVGAIVMGGIAEALGAFGSALTGGPNHASAILQRRVDASIRAQEQAIEGKNTAVKDAYNGVQHYINAGMSQQSAVRAARADLWERTANKIKSEISQFSNPDILARGEALIAAAKENANKELIAEQQSNQARIVRKTISGPAATAAPLSVENQLKLKALEVNLPQVDPKTGKETGAIKVMAPSAEEAGKVREAQRVAGQMKRNLSVMAGLVANTSQSLSPAAKKHVEKLNNQIILDEAVLAKLGALSESDRELASALGDPTAFSQRDSTTLGLIKDATANIDSRMHQHYKSLGWTQ